MCDHGRCHYYRYTYYSYVDTTKTHFYTVTLCKSIVKSGSVPTYLHTFSRPFAAKQVCFVFTVTVASSPALCPHANYSIVGSLGMRLELQHLVILSA